MSAGNAGGARRFSGALLASLALACAGAPAQAPGGELEELMDNLVRRGDENPQAAIDSLHELASMSASSTPARRRAMLTSVGLIAARNGMQAEALAQVDALLAPGRPVDPLAQADGHLIRAELELNAGRGEASYQQARAALDGFVPACTPAPGRPTDCNYRGWWRALHIAERGASEQGNLIVATGYAQAMLDLARDANDRPREAVSLAAQALLAEANADTAGANRLLAQAQRIARTDGSPWVEVSVALNYGLLHFKRQQAEAGQRDHEAALVIANAAGLRREAMRLRANLSDVYIHQGRPADALAAIDLALPVARQHRDLRVERLLMHNATLAKLALGRVAEAKVEMARVLQLWQRDTGSGQRMEALREFGDALGKAGDVAGALDLFHKEEALAREIRAANKQAAEAELRARYDQDSQKRRIELLARDNQLKSAELDNQMITRRLWMLAGAAMVLMGLLALLMYLRMRELNRTLVKHEALLRAHSERDALTGLANRRQFREVMRVRGADKAFKGALLMVDVDHFKRINDQRGHAAGDRVLVEVARRLGAAMRGADLVARWGGEEFLAFAPNIDGPELDQLAERVRVAMNHAPVALEGGAGVEISVSIGYAAFPLPSSHVQVSWEQAVNLADLSLYTAKNHGRNCAVGIVRTTATTLEALREVEADIAQARHDGRVTMTVTPR